MKNKLFFQCLYSILVVFFEIEVNAQVINPDSENSGGNIVVELSPDEYTRAIIGESIPEGARIIKLKKTDSDEEIEMPPLDLRDIGLNQITNIEVEPSEALVIASAMFFQELYQGKEDLGIENQVKILSHQFNIEQNLAYEILLFIDDAIKTKRTILDSYMVDNCEDFNSNLSRVSYADAVTAFFDQLNSLNDIDSQYNLNLLNVFQESFSPEIVTPIVAKITSMAPRVKRSRVTSNSAINLVGMNSMSDRVSNLCSNVLSRNN